MMYEPQGQDDLIYTMLYAAVTMLSLTACGYLLFRRANAIAPDVTSPVRLRRWAAAFFGSMALSHLWFMPAFYLTSSEDILLSYCVGGVFDLMTLFPFAVAVLFSMLQDRRRPLWPVFALLAPNAAVLTVCAISRSDAILPVFYVYSLLLAVGFIIYMVREVRQYGRFLRDNYADLEHKEVWQSFIVLAVILSVLVLYVFEVQVPADKYFTQVNCIILVCYLVWRVETLSDLSKACRGSEICRGSEGAGVRGSENTLSQNISHAPIPPHPRTPANNDDKIGPLLQKHCVDTQLYLQHDLSISQLAQAIGTNRYYLSQYFSRQGITYNAYINGLRIQHFISLYHEALAAQHHFTARQLASESGYRNYTTFSAVFKQLKGQTVTAWMRDTSA